MVKRENPTQADQRQSEPGDETGWETDEDDIEEDDDDDHSHSSSMMGDEHDRHRSNSYPLQDVHEDMDGIEMCSDCGGYHASDSGSHAHTHGLLSQLPCTQQLALTNKLLRNLALPYIYFSVDFEGVENFKMRRFLEEIVPKYGHYMKDVSRTR